MICMFKEIHYYLQMYLIILETNVLKYMNYGLAWQACLKKKVVKLELLTNVDMLLMVEKGIRGKICHAIHRYAKANNNCMKNYDQNKESSYIQYLDVSNL